MLLLFFIFNKYSKKTSTDLEKHIHGRRYHFLFINTYGIPH